MGSETLKSIRYLVELARKREEATVEWYRDYLRSNPKEGVKKLVKSIMDQKQKHLDALAEWFSGLQEAVGEGLVETSNLKLRKPPLYSRPEKTIDFLLFLAESEEWLKAYYEAVAALCQDQDGKFFLGNLSEEQKKYSLWARDFYELECLA